MVFQETAHIIAGIKAYLPREDPIFCLQKDLFDFVLTVRKIGDKLEVIQGSSGKDVQPPPRAL